MIKIPIVSQSQCNRRYSNEITSRMICAGILAGGKDSCAGDSGRNWNKANIFTKYCIHFG